MYSQGERFRGFPERDLSKDLVAEGAGHDKRRVTCRTAEVDKAAFSEEENMAARWHGITVYLGLDVDDRRRVGFEPSYINFNIEVPDTDQAS